MYIKEIEKYIPKNEQELIDKEAMLSFVKRNPDALSRDNLIAHMTVSAIVTNKTLTKVLFAYHLIYKNWAWLGGHNDNDPDCLNVAIKEAKEESGLSSVIPLLKEPIMIDIIKVENHVKKGKYVPDHLHLNLTYLLMADENEALVVKKDENSAVRWFDLKDLVDITNEERMKPIYKKAVDVINDLKHKI